MSNRLRRFVAALTVACLLIPTASDQASAKDIFILVKKRVTGEWTLFGETFKHTKVEAICFGEVGTPGVSIPWPQFTIPDPVPMDLSLVSLRLSGGSGSAMALADLGGSSTIFDDTMFPPPPGVTYDTGGGSIFELTPSAPILLSVPGETPVGGPDLFISSRLDVFDPLLIEATVTLSDGTTGPAAIVMVPEPATPTLMLLAIMTLWRRTTRA